MDKSTVITHLKKREEYYDSDIDDPKVEELLKNIQLADECLGILLVDGVVSSYEYKPGNSIDRLSPTLIAYQMLRKQIHQISVELGINRNDRIKMKLIEQKIQDDFDESFK